MTVWGELVGQHAAVEELQRAVAGADDALAGGPGQGMTHAWLFTGPPGSGRSTAARAFAAALQCPGGGCGTCHACRTSLAGTHPDLTVVRTEQLSITVDVARPLVAAAARRPSEGRWRTILVEDADRLVEAAANVLLKAVEEPVARTVWLLCAPSLEDVLVTIRSRCRHVGLRTPPTRAVAELLQSRDGVDPAMAHFAARAAQGHIGRARRLARDDESRRRRHEALRVPTILDRLSDGLAAAAALVEAAGEEAVAATAELDERETAELSRALGAGTQGRGLPVGAAGQLKELERRQKLRRTRHTRDALDRSLVDIASFYRDVLAVQVGADVELVNDEVRTTVVAAAAASTPEQTLARVDAILECRRRIDANVAPLLAVEALAVALR